MKNIIDQLFPIKTAYAHCDIPCGIYDPHLAQVAAHSVVRMNQLIGQLEGDIRENEHKLVRYTKVKEEHAELVKHEVRVIWGDYFKPEHIEKYPELHNLVFEIMKLASKSRQEINPEFSLQLLSKVQEFAKIFWESKGYETKSCDSTFPTEGSVVVPRASNPKT